MTIEEIKEWRRDTGHLRYHRPVAIEIIDTLLAEADRYKEVAEQLRVQLAGCGVAAMCNTKQSMEQQLLTAHRAAEESAKDAYRRGWEQAKKQADSLLLELVDVVLESKPVVQSARRAIAAMEYTGPAK